MPASALAVLTTDVMETIVGSLRMGNYRQVAARLAGIHPRNLDRWLQAGEDICENEPDLESLPEEEQLLASFYLQVSKAEAQAEATLTRRWRKHTTSDWKAAQAFLKGRHGDRWNEKHEVKLDGDLTATAKVDLSKVPADQLEQLAEILKKATIEGGGDGS